MFEYIHKQLPDLREKNLRITRGYVIKFGGVPFATSRPPETDFPVTDSERLTRNEKDWPELLAKMHSELREALSKNPNLFDISATRSYPGASCPRQNGVLLGGDFFSFTVKLPERLQKFRYHILDPRDVTEDFTVVCNGSLFAAFAKLKAYPILTWIGQETREILKAAINEHTSFSTFSIGPSPIHPDVLVLFVMQDGDSQHARGKRVQAIGENVCVVVDESEQPIQKIVEELFHDVSFSLMRFYELSLSRTNLIRFHEEIGNRYYRLAEAIERVSESHWWNWKAKLSSTREARKQINNILVLYAEYEGRVTGYSSSRTQFLRHLESEPLLLGVKEYFQQLSEMDAVVPTSMITTLAHFDQQVSYVGNLAGLFIASILGAVIGALLGSLLIGK